MEKYNKMKDWLERRKLKRLTERNHTYKDYEFMDSGIAIFMNQLAKYEDLEEQGLRKARYEIGDSFYDENDKIFTIEEIQITRKYGWLYRYNIDRIKGTAKVCCTEYLNGLKRAN